MIRRSRASSSLGGEIADVIASAYLSAAFGAVEIIPQRIEHGIEPEQRRVSSGICPKSSLYYFGAREATIFSKHGSPRRGSQNGISFNSP
jgi:hypothetical protein